MKPIFISLSENPPPGFVSTAVGASEINGADVAVFADQPESALAFLASHTKYRQALVITLASDLQHTGLEPDLCHLQVTAEMLPGLRGTAAALLAAHSSGVAGAEPHTSQLHYLRNLERVDQAIRDAGNFEQLMSDVLQSVLELLQCDRAWLLFPCDPKANSWRIPMMRTRPEYRDDAVMDNEIPVDPEVSAILQAVLDSENPVGFGGQSEEVLPASHTAGFGIKTQLLTALYPTEGQPWALGVHQCSGDRLWSVEDRNMLAEVGERLTVALGNLLFLRESKANEERWRSLTMHLPDHVMLIDFDGTIRFINHTVPDLTVEQVLGTSIYSYMTEDYHAVAAECFREAEATQKLGMYETTYDTAEGGVLYFETLVAPVLDGSETTALLLNSRDITSRVEAEKERVDANENLEQERSMFIAGPVVVFKWRNAENWPVEYVSPNVAEVMGYSVEELTSGAVVFASLIPAEDIQRVGQELVENIDSGAMMFAHEPYRIVCQDGKIIWVEDQTTIVRDEGGVATHFLGYLVDITERVTAEEGRLSLERQVQHAQKLESLGVLAGGIAHDFNNLLVAILGNAELALDDISPMSPARDMIQGIERAALRAADLAKQMLAYSGKGRFVVEAIAAGELLSEMAHLLEVSISKNVNLNYKLAPDTPTFDGDVTQIRQVVMNLITNASEAIGDSHGQIFLSTGVMECDRDYLDGADTIIGSPPEGPLPTGSYVYFEVADTGCGMSLETMAKVFDPFYTTKFTGRGLGMSAVLGIVRGHGGTIRIYSEPGQGSTFKVLFPVNDASSVEVRVPGKTAAEDESWRGTGTILVVDDEETVRGVAKRMFESFGFQVLLAEDGLQGLEVYRTHTDEIVCVLLDLTMPRLGGERTFAELRKLRPNLPVILCSGYNEQDVTQNFVGKGLAGFIQKPFTFSELRETVRDALS